MSNPGESDETRFIRKCLESEDRDDLDPVPASMKELSNVTRISLSGQSILMIPDCIIELKAVKVEELHLSSNPLETRISGNLWKLTTLTDLHLGSCQLTSLPDAIGNLINLETLDVQGNALTSLPDAIGNLRRMKELYLHGNQLTEIPDAIGNLRRMKHLYLNNNQLTEIPDTLGENLLDLEDLRLYNSSL